MKKAYITPPTDFFVKCPDCEEEHKTNTDQEIISCSRCGLKYKAVYERLMFLQIGESNITTIYPAPAFGPGLSPKVVVWIDEYKNFNPNP